MGLFSLTKYKIPNPLTSLIGNPLEQLTHPPPCHSSAIPPHPAVHPITSSSQRAFHSTATHFSTSRLSIIIVASLPSHDSHLLLLPLSFHRVRVRPLIIIRPLLTTPPPSPSSSSVLSFVPLLVIVLVVKFLLLHLASRVCSRKEGGGSE
jgi:hypothetical protein